MKQETKEKIMKELIRKAHDQISIDILLEFGLSDKEQKRFNILNGE